MQPFFHYVLRTVDVPGARAFYRAVLGDGELEIVPLHEQALARGAPPHWLGFIDVGEQVERTAAKLAGLGASSLAPIWTRADGMMASVMRDPGEAVVALARPAQAPASRPPVVWHLLHTRDVGRALENYRELFGWDFREPVDLGALGAAYPFAWAPGLPLVGSMIDVARHPSAHPHWLFFFATPNVEEACRVVRAEGGTALEPLQLPSGQRMAVCEDAQGAAFALRSDR